ncbi:hypothetical protein EC968_003926 [Mortierella alpina]|nr:hypothetical protein EC968_003926 [Mortierella alpina]
MTSSEPRDAHSLSAAISNKPAENDLIPTDHGRTCDNERLTDHDNADPRPTLKLAFSSNDKEWPLQTELSGISASTSTTHESLSLDPPATATTLQSKSHLISTPTRTISGIKRRREVANARGSLYKPFKSPLRSLGQGTASPPKKQMRVSKAGSALQPAIMPSQPCTREPELAASVTESSNSRIPSQGKRMQFRPPFAREPNSQLSTETALGRLMQLQALNARVTELQSTVRKAKQVIQLQQKRDDTPLVELIEKWKKASQEGAQVLLETYISQELVAGPWSDDTGWSKPKEAPFRQSSVSVGDGAEASQSSHRLGGMDRASLNKQHDAEEARLEIQDVQQDLPTVDEAIRSKSWPDVGLQPPVTMTKMQRLLLSLGVNPAVVGYDQDQDAFTSEELPYDGS